MVDKLKFTNHYIKIYLYLIRFSLIKATVYRISFFIELLIELGYTVSFLFFFQIIYSNVNEIAGWNYWQMMMLIGLNIIVTEFIVGFFYVWGLRVIPEKVKDGQIDFNLLKPLHSLFQLSVGEPYLSSIVTMIPGFFLIGLGWHNLQLQVTFYQLTASIMIVISSLFILYSSMVILTSLSFKYINAKELPDIVLELLEFAARPHQIYTGILKIIFFFVVPMVFVSSIPVYTLTNAVKPSYLITAPILAIIFLIIAIKTWNHMIKYYSSASS